MKTIKSIDGKSMLIGCLLASTIFFATGATSSTDKWDDSQYWTWKVVDTTKNPRLDIETEVSLSKLSDRETEEESRARWTKHYDHTGWEPFYFQGKNIIYRKRIK